MPPRTIITLDRSSDFKTSIKHLATYCKPFRIAIIFAGILAMFSAVLSVLGPGYVGQMSDAIERGIFGDIDLNEVVGIAIFLFSIYGASWLLSFLQGYVMAGVSQKVTKKLRSDVSEKIDRMPLKYFDDTPYGDTLSIVTNDVDSVGTALNSSIGSIINASALLIGCFIMMMYTNWILGVVATLTSILGFVLMFLTISKGHKFFIGQQKALGDVNGNIEEAVSNHDIVKAFNGEESEFLAFDKKNKALYSHGWKAQFISGIMMPLMNFVGNIGYVAVCIVGSLLMMNDIIGIATVVSFMIYVRLFTSPMNSIAQANAALQSAAAGGERVFNLLASMEMDDESHKPLIPMDVKGRVTFNNVRFGYTDIPLIKNFSFTAEPGQKIAIVGPTGAGKTTVVNLLMRFYDVDAGTIDVDGIPLKDMTRTQVHELFSMILQDTWIFEGTIRENIAYSNSHATDQDVMNACIAAGLGHFIETLPNGLDTMLDDRTSLSAGQKQQISIARAMVGDAPMLILDEATSSVDTRTEKDIQKAMDLLSEGRTSFVIAHRLSTIRNADMILVMKNGDIVEAGNHDSLISQNGFYKELYNSQFD